MTALRTFLTSDAPDHVVIPVLAVVLTLVAVFA